MGPINKNLIERVKLGDQLGSGLDSDISPAAAAFQIPRVAQSRRMKQEGVEALVWRPGADTWDLWANLA